MTKKMRPIRMGWIGLKLLLFCCWLRDEADAADAEEEELTRTCFISNALAFSVFTGADFDDSMIKRGLESANWGVVVKVEGVDVLGRCLGER